MLAGSSNASEIGIVGKHYENKVSEASTSEERGAA